MYGEIQPSAQAREPRNWRNSRKWRQPPLAFLPGTLAGLVSRYPTPAPPCVAAGSVQGIRRQ